MTDTVWLVFGSTTRFGEVFTGTIGIYNSLKLANEARAKARRKGKWDRVLMEKWELIGSIED